MDKWNNKQTAYNKLTTNNQDKDIKKNINYKTIVFKTLFEGMIVLCFIGSFQQKVLWCETFHDFN